MEPKRKKIFPASKICYKQYLKVLFINKNQETTIYKINMHSCIENQMLFSESFFETESVPNEDNVKIKKNTAKHTSTHMKKWSLKENLVYVKYLIENEEEFKGKNTRRKVKSFKKMSQMMNGTRSAEQCRGHHKKMLEKYTSISLIIEQISSRIFKPDEKKEIDTIIKKNQKFNIFRMQTQQFIEQEKKNERDFKQDLFERISKIQHRQNLDVGHCPPFKLIQEDVWQNLINL